MLARPGVDFSGGDFVAAGAESCPFEAVGDAIIFVSHKYHHVEPVARGRRRVLVVEFWRGAERACGHRCERAAGPCGFVPVRARMEASLSEMTDEDAAAARRFLRGRAGIF